MERAELGRLLGGHATRAIRTVITETDATEFCAKFADAVAGTGEVFLSNPKGVESEREQFHALLASGDSLTAAPFGQSETGWLMIPTGGTSGSQRFARHDSGTISAAVTGFTKHFDLRRVNAVGGLPLYHVSGLMAWLRSVLTGGSYRHADWKEIEAGRYPVLTAQDDGWVLSLVPTQLERLLREAAAVAWLKKFRIILVGGGPAWSELLERAAVAQLPLALCYGMTETAALVTALKPEEFLAGQRNCGAALSHAPLIIDPDGTITIAGKSLFRGYYPGWRDTGVFVTEDIGGWDVHRRLTVLGRRDGVIITGGEKVNPTEVEAVLRGTGEFADVAVVGVPHAEWGSQVVAAYPVGREPDLRNVRDALTQQLARYKHPQRFAALPSWPQQEQGKLNRAEVARMIKESA